MAVSIHVAGVQGKETSVDKERCLADLANLAKQVGLVDWTISLRSLSQKQRELFSQPFSFSFCNTVVKRP